MTRWDERVEELRRVAERVAGHPVPSPFEPGELRGDHTYANAPYGRCRWCDQRRELAMVKRLAELSRLRR